jgi:hypothetical protein
MPAWVGILEGVAIRMSGISPARRLAAGERGPGAAGQRDGIMIAVAVAELSHRKVLGTSRSR